MNLRRVMILASGLAFCSAVAAVAPAVAQSQPSAPAPWPDQPAPQGSPWPGNAPAASPWSGQPVAPQQQFQQQAPNPQEACFRDFGKLRDEAQKRAAAIRDANERHATPKEACGLFNAFGAVESKMIKYAIDNTARCGIPPQIIENLKQQHAKSSEIRTQVCRAAAAPPRPTGPTLSDTLSGPVPGANNIKTGRGTFDTLTGTPLGTK
jgi:hypothetical protein